MAVQHSRITLEINTKALRQNINTIRKRVFPSKVLAVVKANAYGLGIENIAPLCFAENIKDFGIAEFREGLSLRKLLEKKINIYILGTVFVNEIESLIQEEMVIPIDTIELSQIINAQAKKQNKIAKVQILIDSGMGRLGCLPKDFPALYQTIQQLSHLKLIGIFSHFANANQIDDPYTKKQMYLFSQISQTYANKSILFHLANSDGINNYPDSYYHLIRTGINLYGVFDLQGSKAYTLDPTLTLKTYLIAKKKLPQNHGVGYGHTYRVKKETLVGTLPMGYADGLPLALSNRGKVLIRNKICNIIWQNINGLYDD